MCCLLCATLAFALPPKELATGSGLAKSFSPSNIDYQTYIDVNQLLMFVTNQGSFAYDNVGTLGKVDGLYYPRGTNLTALYAAGIWLGGTVDGDLRVSLAEYAHTYWPGPMVGSAPLPDADTDSQYHVYKIFKALWDQGFYSAPRPLNDPEQQKLWDDYRNWPVTDGAPVDCAGTPLIIGDQTTWCVFNDVEPSVRTNAAGSPLGLGVEVQNTAFAWDLPGPLGKTIFMKYLLINKGGQDIEDMYVSFWADPDVGDESNDYVGCDKALDLGYAYNAEVVDAEYGEPPPAVGIMLLQGPRQGAGFASLKPSAPLGEESAVLPMTSFSAYRNGTDPDSARESYWYMQGLDAKNSGAPIIDAWSGLPTTLMYSGDPVAHDGWTDDELTVQYDGTIRIEEIAGPGGIPVDPPDNVYRSYNSTWEYRLSTDRPSDIARFDWRGHLGDDTWEIRFTASGSEYFDWGTDMKFPNRAPFEVWNLSGGSDGNPLDRRIQFTILDDDESGGWSPGDRIYFLEREYFEPLPMIAEYTWDDDFRLGRVIINEGIPATGTVISLSFQGVVWHFHRGTDRRFMLSSGPFTMAPGDTQETWTAIIVGQGVDHLSSVTQLKQSALTIRELFNASNPDFRYLQVCAADVTGQPPTIRQWALYKKPKLPLEPELIPPSLNIFLTLCEPVELTVHDSAQVYVDFDGNGIFDDDEQYPAAVTAVQGNPARQITIAVDLKGTEAPGGTLVTIRAIAGRITLDEQGRLLEPAEINTDYAYEGNQEPIARVEPGNPVVFALEGSCPNPFNTSTRIVYSLAEAGPVTLTIHDILGRRVKTIVKEIETAGRHEAFWDGRDNQGNTLSSGMYFCRLEAGGFAEIRKMVLMK